MVITWLHDVYWSLIYAVGGFPLFWSLFDGPHSIVRNPSPTLRNQYALKVWLLFSEITFLVLINLSLIILTKVKIQVETVALNSSTSLSAYCKLRELCMLMCSIKLRPKLVDIKSILKTTISSTKSAILFSKPSNWAWRLSNNAVMIRLSGVVLPANYNFDLMIEVNLPGQGVLCEHSVEFNNCW